MTIDNLPDEVLSEIFDRYLRKHGITKMDGPSLLMCAIIGEVLYWSQAPDHACGFFR
jgi:hypothetical protein